MAVKGKPKYVFRQSYRVPKGVDPESVAQEFVRIERAGPLTAKSVVDAARKDSSPLHECFTWDDSLAAERYRLAEAGELIRSVQVVYPSQPEIRARSIRAHVPQDPETGRGHWPLVDVIVRREDWYTEALREATTKLHSAYAAVNELVSAAKADKRKPETLARLGAAIESLKAAQLALGAA